MAVAQFQRPLYRTRCDRCARIREGEDTWGKGWAHVDGQVLDGDPEGLFGEEHTPTNPADLCPDCVESLRQWFTIGDGVALGDDTQVVAGAVAFGGLEALLSRPRKAYDYLTTPGGKALLNKVHRVAQLRRTGVA